MAEHSFRVGMLYAFLGGKELIAAFGHDAEEAITGDIPSPAKKHIKGLDYFESMRPQFQDNKEARLGKLCDKLELVLDLREQLEDTGKLPKRLMQVYEDELESVHDIAKELGLSKEVKQLLKAI